MKTACLAPVDLGVLVGQELVELEGGEDPRVLAVEVLVGLEGLAARGHDGDPVVQHPFAVRGLEGGVEVADEAAGVLDLGVEQDFDLGVATSPS